MAAATKKAVLLFDSVSWMEDGARHDHDGKGTEVELPADEFARLEKLGAVASPRSKAAKAAADGETAEEPPAEEPPAE